MTTTISKTTRFSWITIERLILFFLIFTNFSVHSQTVLNGDFEELSPLGINNVPGNNVWTPPSNPAPGIPSSPQPNYSYHHISLTDVWNTYHLGGTQGMDLHMDVRGANWAGNYLYDALNHAGGVGSDHILTHSVPGYMGTNQTSGPAMLIDGDPSNGLAAYPHLAPNNESGAQILGEYNEFLEGRFSEPLDIFRKYTMSFKYSIPCDEASSNGHSTDNITINLFNQELINSMTESVYANTYLNGTSSQQGIRDINSSTFNWERYPNGNGLLIDSPGSHRLEIHKEQIQGNMTPCQWNTVTFEFCIADLMCDPMNNTLQINPLYANTPIGFMHNGHMFDVDFYNAHSAGWPYTFPQSPTLTVANFINNGIIPDGLLLYDFKEVFGITVNGTQEVYIDDFSISDAGCTLETDFTVTQSCTIVEGVKMVTFELTPNGPSYNPYLFKVRNLTTGSAWSQVSNSALPLGGTHTYTVPYVAGEQYEFLNGTWSPGSDNCGWTQETKVVTVDPQGDWFATTPDFTMQGLSYSGFPSSWFGILANPGTLGLTSEWEYQIEYANSTLSPWMQVSTSANPTGNGNNQFIIWFDCNDVPFPFLEPDAVHSNVKVVNVKRTNFGSCAEEGVSQIQSFVHCVQSGKSANDMTDISKSEVESLMGVEIPEEFMRVFPNPATDDLNVQFINSKNRTISIVTLSGREAISAFKTSEQSVRIPLTNLSSGLYFVKVETVDGTQMERIVKK